MAHPIRPLHASVELRHSSSPTPTSTRRRRPLSLSPFFTLTGSVALETTLSLCLPSAIPTPQLNPLTHHGRPCNASPERGHTNAHDRVSLTARTSCWRRYCCWWWAWRCLGWCGLRNLDGLVDGKACVWRHPNSSSSVSIGVYALRRGGVRKKMPKDGVVGRFT